MQIVLGPLPATAVSAWVDNALLGVELAERGGPAFPFAAPSTSLAPAMEFFAQWVELASAAGDAGHPFRWEGEVDGEVALHLLRYWHNIGRAMLQLSDRGEVPPVDPLAERFADALLRAMLDGLVYEGLLAPPTADRMWDNWPRSRRPAGVEGGS